MCQSCPQLGHIVRDFVLTAPQRSQDDTTFPVVLEWCFIMRLPSLYAGTLEICIGYGVADVYRREFEFADFEGAS